PFVQRLGNTIGTGKDIRSRVRDTGDTDLLREQRPGHLARRPPSRQRAGGNGFEITSQPTCGCRVQRIRRAPDVESLEVRPARILVTRALNDGEAALVEDALQPGEPWVQAERSTTRVGSDLQHLPGGHGNRWPPTVIELILIGHYGVQRIVAASEIRHYEAARSRALRAGNVAQERRRREADRKRCNTAADEITSRHWHARSPVGTREA